MFTVAVNNAVAGGKNLQSFIDSLKNAERESRYLSEKDLRKMGFAKKG